MSLNHQRTSEFEVEARALGLFGQQQEKKHNVNHQQEKEDMNG